ncbi:MAG TPA: four helix bundle protein [Lentisphaeria bacterium]|nr:MAG: four helix bundle protein [Lentisphaerae bacterium GWF2_38_69]HBM16978.1 four helix bundle protein [Lentisphaeria bacterium]
MEEKRKLYDLEERTLVFAKSIRSFVKALPRNLANIEDAKHLIRSSGSIGANYREANESLGKRDFFMRIRISRKEAKESIFWLELIDVGNNTDLDRQRRDLIVESTELMKIFGSILQKSGSV